MACTRSNCRGRAGAGKPRSASAVTTFRAFAVGPTTIALRLSRASKYTGMDSMEPWNARRLTRHAGRAFNHMLSHHRIPLKTRKHTHRDTRSPGYKATKITSIGECLGEVHQITGISFFLLINSSVRPGGNVRSRARAFLVSDEVCLSSVLEPTPYNLSPPSRREPAPEYSLR